MRLFLLTALTMVAFAANSLLNRLALTGGGIDALSFGTIRLAAGALTLAAVCLLLRGRLDWGGRGRVTGVLALLAYIYGFSLAYVALDAGLGALILFGTVQLTMFAGALIGGERPSPRRWAGTALACAGLVWLLAPGAAAPAEGGYVLCMVAAGVGWGVYSLAGRGARDALQATAANFAFAVPLGVAFGVLSPSGLAQTRIDGAGIALAIVSGAVTSGLGYALWYTVLPRLQASVAALSQLTVPAIAMAGGIVVLAEAPTLRFVLASAMILGGVALGVLPRGRARGQG